MKRFYILKLYFIVLLTGFLWSLPSSLQAQCTITFANNTTADTVRYAGTGLVGGCGIFNPASLTVTLYENDVFIIDPPPPSVDSVTITNDLTVEFNGGGKVLIEGPDSVYVGGDLIIPKNEGTIQAIGDLVIGDDVLGAGVDDITFDIDGLFQADSMELDKRIRIDVSGSMLLSKGLNIGDRGNIDIRPGGVFQANSFSALDDLELDVDGDFEIANDFVVSDDAEINVKGLGSFEADNFISDDEILMDIEGDLLLSGDFFTGEKANIDVSGTFEADDFESANDMKLEIDGTMDLSGDLTTEDEADIEVDGQLGANSITGGDDIEVDVNGSISVATTFTLGDDAEITSSLDTGEITGGDLILGSNPSCVGSCALYGFSSCTGDCGPISFDSNNILPVEWLSFDYRLEEVGVVLRWQTASELNNSHFEIERKVVGLDQQFQTIGRVAGAGNSEEVLNYTFTDDKPYIGNVLYRIRQIDFDGAYDYSSTIEVRLDAQSLDQDFNVYPNPARDVIFTDIPASSSSEKYDLEVRNLQGQRVMFRKVQADIAAQTLKWDISSLPSGIYIIQIKNEKNLHQDKIIKR